MLTEQEIDNAILMSTFSKRPAHISGIWFAWGETVVPKRMLLAMMMMSHGQYITSHAATAVITHYVKISDQVPDKYKIKIDEFFSANAMLNNLTQRTLDKLNPIGKGDDDFLVGSPRLPLDNVRAMIVEIFGNEHEDNTETV